MENLDIEYLCTVIGNLSGVPIRLYRGEELVFSHALVHLPKDPVELYRESIWKITEHVGYYATDIFNYYGIINFGANKLILGPTRQLGNTDQELRGLAFRLDVPPEETEEFLIGMKSIVRMPLESIMQILCTVNYVLNGEKLTLQDISIYDSEQAMISRNALAEREAQSYITDTIPYQDIHNTYSLEQTLMTIVRKGDTAALQEWVKSAPAVRGGIIAAEQLRQMKNTFIVSATLASRAAIRGGLSVEEAFSLSDSYIQKCELVNNPHQITNLQYHMFLEFTQRVERIRIGKQPSKLVTDVANYIRQHLSEPITAEDIAKELYLSRPYLSRKFIAETGESLTDFILKEKVSEAKRLLRYSDKPLAAIGNYLGFSSQGHFSRVFKRYTGLTPGEYRANYMK